MEGFELSFDCLFFYDRYTAVPKAPVTLSHFDCYVLLRFKMLRFISFFDGLYVSLRIYCAFLRFSTYCYVLPRFIENAKHTLCYASLRFATYALRFTTLRYLLVRFSTFQLRSITFEVRFDTFILRFSTSYYVTIKHL
jgi:hypothetical protein